MGRSRPIIDSRRYPRVGASSSAIQNTRARQAQQQITREEAASQASTDRFTTESLAQMTLTNIAQSQAVKGPSDFSPQPMENSATPKQEFVMEMRPDAHSAPAAFEPKSDAASFFRNPEAAKMEVHTPGYTSAVSPTSQADVDFADEINRSIDDALNLADSISMQNRESIDNLDIPTFLRNEIKNLNI